MTEEYKGLYTPENKKRLLEAATPIDSSVKESKNKKGQWYINIFGDKPSTRATIWITPTHIRIYAGIETRLFGALDYEQDYKYKDKERRKTFKNVNEAVDFIGTLYEYGKAMPKDGINIPLKPTAVINENDGNKIVCPTCDSIFRSAKRCPNCGQLIDYSEE